MTRKEWLEEKIICDEWGRPPSLADVPLTIMTRKEALVELNKSPYDESTIHQDIEFIATKLGISVEELNGYMNMEKKTYMDYKSQKSIFLLGARVMRFFGLEKGGKR